jgi:hypothetical protein
MFATSDSVKNVVPRIVQAGYCIVNLRFAYRAVSGPSILSLQRSFRCFRNAFGLRVATAKAQARELLGTRALLTSPSH